VQQNPVSFSELAVDRERLPGGTSLRVAVRRAVRSGSNDGLPIEDIGVTVPPENVHALTKKDLLEGNQDLLRFAARKLMKGPNPW